MTNLAVIFLVVINTQEMHTPAAPHDLIQLIMGDGLVSEMVTSFCQLNPLSAPILYFDGIAVPSDAAIVLIHSERSSCRCRDVSHCVSRQQAFGRLRAINADFERQR